MSDLLLGPLLRYQDSSTATLWVEVSEPTTVEILGTTTTTFAVGGRHYALVIVEHLEPDTVYEYEVRLDGRVVWPEPDSPFPPSIIRTEPRDRSGTTKFIVGSCRAAAPHEEPYTREHALDDEGRGIDALWAHAERMAASPSDAWPHLAILNGDQIYADDSSPRTRERIERLRPDDSDLPAEIVANYEEYCWLYHDDDPPRSIVVASGDIHYSYAARIPSPEAARAGVPVWQVVSSPMRNALIPPERGVMRFTLTRAGRVIGGVLRRAVRAPDTRPGFELATGPLFANNLGVIEYGDEVWLAVEHDVPDERGRPTLADIPRVRLV